MPLQATNSGIDYQCRVSAWYLINMMCDSNLALNIKSSSDVKIESIQLEGNSCIDDMIVKCSDNKMLYFQMKRNISFSTLQSSEFVKVLKQFVKQDLSGHESGCYILATSNKASKKIVDKMRRLLSSVRLSDVENAKKVFNKADNELWAELVEVVSVLVKDITKQEVDENYIEEFFKRVYIETYDIEKGESFEKSVLVFVDSKIDFDADTVWNLMISYSLNLAANRNSITYEGLQRDFGNYINFESTLGNDNEIIANGLRQEFVLKDYLIVTSDDLDEISQTKNVLYVLDLYRFNEQGKKKYDYYGPDKLVIADIEYRVLHRFNSWLALENCLEENKDELGKYDELCIIPSKPSDDINVYEKMHFNWAKEYIRLNLDKEHCSICGEIIDESTGFLIEHDNCEEEKKIGCCHVDCVRPTDRIIGSMKIEKSEYLKYVSSFDSKLWIESIENGQGMLKGLSTFTDTLHYVAWNSVFDSFVNGNYCVRNILKDGEVIYTKSRGKVDRMSRQVARKLASQFDKNHKKYSSSNNPVCYTSKTLTYGHYDNLRVRVGADEDYMICVGSEAVPYNIHLSELYDICKDYYAPLLCLYTEDGVLQFDEFVPLISDITRLNELLNNWRRTLELPEEIYKARIISTDSEFDNFIKSQLLEKRGVGIDIKFGIRREVLSGVIIVNEQNM